MRRERERADGAAGDGRNIDLSIGVLEGEGSAQQVRSLEAPEGTLRVEDRVPTDAAAAGDYYGLPVLAAPVWSWYIPAYFYVGGVAGAVAALGAATQVSRGGGGHRRRGELFDEHHRLVRRARILSTSGAALSAVLLVADLGRPARFFQMMRVFRPSSPMNMGTWILSAFGGCAALATASHVLPVPRSLRRAGDLVAVGTGVMGLPLCSYTGVLVANTAVPIWQGTRRSLPLLFAASGAAGAASLLELWPPGGEADRIVHRFALAGKALETVFMAVLEREARAVPRVGLPLRRGASGAMWKAAKLLSVAGLAMSVVGRRQGAARRIAGLLGTAGALALRFAILQAGRASALDPRAVSDQQRARPGAAAATPVGAGRSSHPPRSSPGAQAPAAIGG